MKNSLKFTTYELFLALRFFVNMAQDLLCVMAVLVVNLHLHAPYLTLNMPLVTCWTKNI